MFIYKGNLRELDIRREEKFDVCSPHMTYIRFNTSKIKYNVKLNFRSQGKLKNEELNFLLTGGVGLENTIPNPAHSWLSAQSWDEMCRMNDANPVFKSILPETLI